MSSVLLQMYVYFPASDTPSGTPAESDTTALSTRSAIGAPGTDRAESLWEVHSGQVPEALYPQPRHARGSATSEGLQGAYLTSGTWADTMCSTTEAVSARPVEGCAKVRLTFQWAEDAQSNVAAVLRFQTGVDTAA